MAISVDREIRNSFSEGAKTQHDCQSHAEQSELLRRQQPRDDYRADASDQLADERRRGVPTDAGMNSVGERVICASCLVGYNFSSPGFD